MTAIANDADALDYRDAVPGFLVRGGGFVLMAAGLLVAGSGLQHLLFLASASWLEIVAAAVLMTLGTIASLVGPSLVLGRSWAALLGVPVALGMVLFAVPWGIYSTVALFLSPLTWLAMAMSLLAMFAVPAAVPGSLKATRARNALYR
jgi:hypothetical protein